MWLSFWVTYFVVCVGLSAVVQVWLLSRWRKLRAREWKEERKRELEGDSVSSSDVLRREWERNSELRQLMARWPKREAIPISLYWPLTLFIAIMANAVFALLMVLFIASINS